MRVLLHQAEGHDLRIVYLPSGKPYLINSSTHISISHTNGYVAIALHPNCEVGIDIERISPRIERVAPRFVHPDEELSNVTPEERLRHHLLLWCAKETLFKIVDNEGIDFQHHFFIPPFQPATEGSFTASYKQQRTFTVAYRLTPDYALTWSCEREDTAE